MNYLDFKYKYSFIDQCWMAFGIGQFAAAIWTGMLELFLISIPIILLSYKIIMQSRHIQDQDDEINELLYGHFSEIDYAKEYFIPDAVPDRITKPR